MPFDLAPDLSDILLELSEFSNDPLGHVMFSYPWGEPGELEEYDGPETWQVDLLSRIGKGVVSIENAIAEAMAYDTHTESRPIQLARTSGHGIGKSACVSWIILWAISTLEDTKGVVTANTENQLKTKTWAEVAKWYRLFIGKELFKLTATALFSVDPEHERTWRIDMVPWSEKNMEAFAGLHNKGRRILIIFDEASAIADPIWETTEGALTDKNTQIIWCVFGNPTKNSGRFRNCFPGGKFAKRWDSRAIDSRECRITNHEQINRWIEDYGEDHDFIRVRVRGMFPRVDATSFIPLELAQEATRRPLPEENLAAVVLGVDVARFGDDASCIYPRQGRDARSRPPRLLHGLNTRQLATEVFNDYVRYGATAIFVDGGGVGGGVVDSLLEMGLPVYEVTFGGKPDNSNPHNPHTKYLNKRAEITGAVKDWLPTGCIPERVQHLEVDLPTELSTPTYTYAQEDKIQLESKKDMKRRGEKSPDVLDALATTFAYPVADFALPGVEQEGEYYTNQNSYTEEYYNAQ
jgi:hypothetical protein